MALIIPSGYAQVLIPIYHVSGANPALVTHGISGADPIFAGAQADEITTLFTATFGTQLDAGCGIGPTSLVIGTGVSGENFVVTGTGQGSGAVTGETMPPNVSLLVRKTTARGGRRGRGRMYLPWVLRDDGVDDVGNVNSGPLANLQTAADDYLTGLLALSDPAPMVILHSAGGSTAPGTPNAVTGLVVDQRIATQRRRLRS